MARLLAAAVTLVWLVGCSATFKAPDLGGLYNREAGSGHEQRNPVIVIPGILGSRLIEEPTGRVVWGAFAGDYADPRHAEGARLVALPMAQGVPLAELRDQVISDGALDRVRVDLLILQLNIGAYVDILATLGVGGYRDQQLGQAGAVDYGKEHYTCFQFDYDWRRDLVENAARFGRFLDEKAAYVSSVRGDDRPVRFDVVAHSMGGLVARYYLRYGASEPPAGAVPTWRGADRLENIVFVGTPNAGSVMSLGQLVNGVRIGPFLPTYNAVVLGTMPAIYQLLPRSRHGRVIDLGTGEAIDDLYDIELWKRNRWGLASPDADATLRILLPDIDDAETRRRIALDHLEKCLVRARRINAALDIPASPPPGVRLKLVAGDAIPTQSIMTVDPATGRIRVSDHAPGDGTVTRDSALMDERVGGEWQPRLVSPVHWDSVHFLFTDHLGLTKDPGFADNVLYILLEEPR